MSREYILGDRIRSFCAGDKPSFLDGVFLYCRRVLHNFSSFIPLPFQATLIILFMDLTAASALPLLCGLLRSAGGSPTDRQMT